MDKQFYLHHFEQIEAQLDSGHKDIIHQSGFWLDSVVLRLQKKHWSNYPDAKPQTGSAIFFSIWVNEKSIKDNKLFYNIHALKLRQLKGHHIKSRDFADSFRKLFKKYQKQWPNVSTLFGPQTLMEGWQELRIENFQNDIAKLTSNFLEIDFIIDELLDGRKSKKSEYEEVFFQH
ncbi:MAG: hypothetical protein ABI844_02945 [Saprospiraceae bacterium]